MKVNEGEKIQTVTKKPRCILTSPIESLVHIDYSPVLLTVKKKLLCFIHSLHYKLEVNTIPKFQLKTKTQICSSVFDWKFCLRLSFLFRIDYHIANSTVTQKFICPAHCKDCQMKANSVQNTQSGQNVQNHISVSDWTSRSWLNFLVPSTSMSLNT